MDKIIGLGVPDGLLVGKSLMGHWLVKLLFGGHWLGSSNWAHSWVFIVGGSLVRGIID